MLKIKNRLKKRKEFAYIFRKGKKVNMGEISGYIVKSRFPQVRFGITVSNKVGNAVVRNKVKRRLRSILVKYINQIRYKNIVIVVHPEVVNLNYQQLSEKVDKIIKKV